VNLEEIKALGAPFRAAEVQVSLRTRIARLVLVIRVKDNPSFDFRLNESESDFEAVGREVLESARRLGLIDDEARQQLLTSTQAPTEMWASNVDWCRSSDMGCNCQQIVGRFIQREFSPAFGESDGQVVSFFRFRHEFLRASLARSAYFQVCIPPHLDEGRRHMAHGFQLSDHKSSPRRRSCRRNHRGSEQESPLQLVWVSHLIELLTVAI